MNCIIVDDEPLAREGIELLVKSSGQLNLVTSFNNGTTAGKFLVDNEIDLIFLDINMPGMSGIEFAEKLDKKTLVIFITAYAEYALKSYELDAIDYLVKPVSKLRFEQAIQKALDYHKLLVTENNKENIESVSTDHIFIKSERKYYKLIFKDILYIEGLKDYVIIHTAENKIITSINVKTIHSQLPAHIFARISKSSIINVDHITSLDNNSLFIGKQELTIGSNYKDDFFNNYIQKRLIRK